MSLLAFSGLLGGLLKEGKKFGVGIGLFVGTFLVGIYGDATAFMPSFMESFIAISFFFLTPARWIKNISRYIPERKSIQISKKNICKKFATLQQSELNSFRMFLQRFQRAS